MEKRIGMLLVRNRESDSKQASKTCAAGVLRDALAQETESKLEKARLTWLALQIWLFVLDF